MARAQTTPFGMWAKERIDVGSQQLTYNSTALLLSGGMQLSGKSTAVITGDSTGIVLAGGVKVSNKANGVVTADSTGLLLAGGVKVSNAQLVTATSTGLVFGNPVSALPGAVDNGVLIGVISDSTGVSFFVNTTGTTHKYLSASSVRTV